MSAARRDYKSLLTQKKSAFYKNLWADLANAALCLYPSLFWSKVALILQDSRSSLDSLIAPKAWIDHFSGVFYDASREDLVSLISPCENVWPEVTGAEVTSLLGNFATGKAPGLDAIPIELYKKNVTLWAPILAKLFTYIDHSGDFPKLWNKAVVVPIFKKGNKLNPECYRPINLICVTAKLYARHLLTKLDTWVRETNILTHAQAGFRSGFSTVHNCFILQHLVTKYNTRHIPLYAAFVDFKAAFDSIDRKILWDKLQDLKIDKRLLWLLQGLHLDNKIVVRLGRDGRHTKEIPVNKGVRQGCILAPILFSLYLNDLPDFLLNEHFHPPKIGSLPVNCLLYADDTILLSHSQVGLRRLLRHFVTYCNQNVLSINYNKTKIMVFTKQPKTYRWTIEGHHIEQVRNFTYLGLVFAHNGSWKPHYKHLSTKAMAGSQALMKLVRHNSPSSIETVIKIYNAKILPILTYGAELWGHGKIPLVERTQATFFKLALGLDRNTPVAALRAELGLQSVSSRSVLRMYKFGSCLLDPEAPVLARLALTEQLTSPSPSSWIMQMASILQTLGFSLVFLSQLGPQALPAVKQRLIDCQKQEDMALVAQGASTKWLARNKVHHTCETYLKTLLPLHLRRVFVRFRFEQHPSNVRYGRFRQIPYQNRLCVCGTPMVEDLIHTLLECPLYTEERERALNPILRELKCNSLDSKKFGVS